MARPLLAVRDATPDDLPDLLAMWRELRELGGWYERAAPPPTEEGVLARLHRAAGAADLRIVVATSGASVVGMAVLTAAPFAALVDTTAVHVHYLHTRAGCRRRGVGHALLAAAAAFAEEIGAEHVVTSVHPQLREAQRFYARLGFAPMVLRRVAPVTTLRRKLAVESPAAGLDGLLARRRTLRSRTSSAPVRTLPR